MKISTWIKVGRIHTACLTFSITILGYIAAGGRELINIILLFIFGLLWHYVGFLDNNCCDYEYDKKDPNKKHFPLVTGEIKLLHAQLVVFFLLIILFTLGIYISNNNPLSIWILSMGILSGLIYNRFNKITYLKVLPISICFSFLPLFSYTLISIDFIGFLIFLFVFTQILFQIGFSGELKEIEALKERNILRALGARVEWHWKTKNKYLFTSKKYYIYSISLKLVNLLIGAILTYFIGNYYIFILFSILTLISTILLIKEGEWNRDKKLKEMSLVEILTYFTFVSCVWNRIGFYYGIFFIVFPIIWFYLFNKWFWGTVTYPKV
jgi:4-hydroxybenzoate polyprenyltransferase